MYNDKNKDAMHPQDLRNMFIFFIIAAILYFVYDAYVLRPQAEYMRQHQAAQAQMLKTHPELAAAAPKVATPREDALKDSPRVSIDNGEIFGSIALKGARLDDVAFHNYFDAIDKKKQTVLLSPPGTEFPRYVDYGWVAADAKTATPKSDSVWRVVGPTKNLNAEINKDAPPLTLAWDNGQGLVFQNEYSIDQNYVLTITQKVTNNTGKEISLSPYGLISQTGLRPDFAPIWIANEGPVGYMGSSLEEFSFGGIRKAPSQEFQASSGWTGITDKYWLTALMPPQGQDVKYRYNYIGTPPQGRAKDTGKYQVDFTAAPMTIASGKSAESESHLFVGAKKVVTLADYGRTLNVPHFDLAVDFGWFWFFTMPFFYLLHFLAATVGNFGVALILMTLIVRSAVFPLTNISYKSFAKMKKVSPQVAELRKAYADDKQKLQEELVKLYAKEGVNPMAGCLPIVVQIPIFFSLYKVLVTTIEMRQAPFFGWIQDLSAPDPSTIFNLFGLIPWTTPWWVPHVGVWPCFLLIAFLIQRRLNPPPQDQISRDMNVYYPFLMCYMMSRFASGLVIYWAFSAFIGITQQIIIMRRMNVPIYLFGETDAENKIDEQLQQGSPGVHPLLEMAEQDVEKSITGDDDTPGPTISPFKPRRKKKK